MYVNISTIFISWFYIFPEIKMLLENSIFLLHFLSDD